jgi:hypothetical protein
MIEWRKQGILTTGKVDSLIAQYKAKNPTVTLPFSTSAEFETLANTETQTLQQPADPTKYTGGETVSGLQLSNQEIKLALDMNPEEAAYQMTIWKDQGRLSTANADYLIAEFAAKKKELPFKTAADIATSAQIREQANMGVRLTPWQEKAMQSTYGATAAQGQTAAQRESLKQQNLAGYGSDVSSQFFNSSLSGVDVNKRMSEAANTARMAGTAGEEMLKMKMAGLGASNPAQYASALEKLKLDQAANIAAATENARRTAEQEQYARVAGAYQSLGMAS